MTKLLVALDAPLLKATKLYDRLRRIVDGFKVGVASLLEDDGPFLANTIVKTGGTLMVDLKLYDTADTVTRVINRVDQIGAQLVTVHTDVAQHACNVAVNTKVIAVNRLTDSGDTFITGGFLRVASFCDGAVCPPDTGAYMKRLFPKKIIICPGVRPVNSRPDNHKWPMTPKEVAASGVDYIVVGRPIIEADDPEEAAARIIAEINEQDDNRIAA